MNFIFVSLYEANQYITRTELKEKSFFLKFSFCCGWNLYTFTILLLNCIGRKTDTPNTNKVKLVKASLNVKEPHSQTLHIFTLEHIFWTLNVYVAINNEHFTHKVRVSGYLYLKLGQAWKLNSGKDQFQVQISFRFQVEISFKWIMP